ncbi:MAG: efflux RND transporter periplasmic adaptor subunit [Chthoniobacterales bacterium]
MKKLTLIRVLLACILIVGWNVGCQKTSPASPPNTQKVSHYQCSMHPWIRSDHPGKCTICGMDLVPVFANQSQPKKTNFVMLPEGAPQASSIRTAEVRRQKLIRTLRFAGTIEDNDSRHRILSAYTGGRIEKLFVNYEGAEVEEGQPLALFYSRELLSAAREYALSRKQNNNPIASVGATRLQQLGLTQQQIAKIPERAENDLYFEILAPITGTVVKRAAYEGQYVQEGEKLMEIADFSTMWLQFQAYEQDLPLLKVGQKVEVTLSSLPSKTLEAPIIFINPNLDNTTRSAMVRVEVANPQRELLHKTYAEVRVTAESPEMLTVPRSAVLWSGKQPRVYVEKSVGNYEPRAVTLGQPGDEAWEVMEGLSEGEHVVVSGNMLIDGQAQMDRLGDSVPQDERHSYLAGVVALSEALAADDLQRYRIALTKLPAAPAGFSKKAPEPGNDLETTRQHFQPFSETVVAAAQKIRRDIPNLKIFSCPMSNQAADGVPKNARWVQLSPAIHNPYLGKEMLNCGEEVP